MIANKVDPGKLDVAAEVFAAASREFPRLTALEAMVSDASRRPICDELRFSMCEIIAGVAYSIMGRPKGRDGVRRYELVLTHLATIFSGGQS